MSIELHSDNLLERENKTSGMEPALKQNENNPCEPGNREPNVGWVSGLIERPHLVIVSVLFSLIVGTLSLLALPKDLLPISSRPAVQVMAFYPGMPVDRIEKSLTRRLELATGQALGVERQESRSLAGVSVIRNLFNSSVDLNSALTQTTSLIMSALRRLPAGTQPPLIMPYDPSASTPIALVAVSGNLPEKSLYDLARYQVRNSIQAIPGAMAPTVMGGSERSIIVELDLKRLSAYNFSPLDVVERLNRFNTFVPSGSIDIGTRTFQLLANGAVEQIDEINEFPLRADHGVVIPLAAVGKTKDSSKPQTNQVMIDGKPQVYVPIYRQPGGNTLKIIEDSKNALKKLQSTLHGVALSLVADQSQFVRQAIDSISHEAMIGGGLAGLLVLLILGSFRATLGALISLPLSILWAMLGLKLSGQTINVMTLGGIALSIGVLVDNSIVVLENISKKLEEGATPKIAATQGATEVATPILISTLCTLLVLFPVVLLQGISRTLFVALAFSITFALIGSYYSSLVVIPLYASRFLKQKGADPLRATLWNLPLRLAQALVAKLEEKYERALSWLMPRKWVLLAPILCLLGVAVAWIPYLGTELFPRADTGNFVVNLRLSSGSSIANTSKLGEELEHRLRQWIDPRDLRMIIMNAGVYYGFPAAFTPNSGSQDLFFNVDLSEDRKHTSQFYAKIIRAEMRRLYPQIEVGIELGGLLTSALNGGLRAPINIQIESKDLSKSIELANQFLTRAKKVPGVVDARVQQRLDSPILELNINRTTVGALGLDVDSVMKNIVSVVSGSTSFNSTSVWVDPKSGIDYSLGVLVPQSRMSSLKELMDLPIKAAKQDFGVPLRRLASVSESRGPTEVNHVNLKTVVDVFMDAEGRDIGAVSRDAEKILQSMKWPEGVRYEMRGEIGEMSRTAGSLGLGFILSIILVFLVLAVQFRSFILPALLLGCIPLGLCGIVLMLGSTSTFVSIQAGMGAIFLIGIAVANGVLLIEFVLHQVQSKPQAWAVSAIISGARQRLRPILMTSISSMLGLVPMALGLGKGAEANIPLGRAVIGGQFVATLATLFILPLLYHLALPYLGREFQGKEETLTEEGQSPVKSKEELSQELLVECPDQEAA